MEKLDQIVARVDDVLRQNRRTEYLLLGGTAVLFATGIGAIVMALVTQQFAWSIPSAFTAFFLKWPIKQIQSVRKGNIALSVAPLLIKELPPAEAAREIQKLLEQLFKDAA